MPAAFAAGYAEVCPEGLSRHKQKGCRMNNVGMAGAVALVGVGLITIGLGNFVSTPQAVAAAPVVAVEAGPVDSDWFAHPFLNGTS